MCQEGFVEHFEKAEELINALRRCNKRWESNPRNWVFRGHADASWELLPAALRTPTMLTHHPNRLKKPYEKTYDQVSQEIEAVLNFVSLANYHGLPIPGDSFNVISSLERDFFSVKKELSKWKQFPSPETIEAFALAQHHGVPTRLLDWTYNPLCAAYFAGSGAAKMLNENTEPPENLGIWCFNIRHYNNSDSEEDFIHFVSPPRASNLNLLAQNGLFTVHIHPLVSENPPKIVPLNELVYRHYQNSKNSFRYQGLPIRLLTLPVSQCRRLLRHLADEDITASKLFPGYDGIVTDLKEGRELHQNYKCPPDEF